MAGEVGVQDFLGDYGGRGGVLGLIERDFVYCITFVYVLSMFILFDTMGCDCVW